MINHTNQSIIRYEQGNFDFYEISDQKYFRTEKSTIKVFSIRSLLMS